jgi:L-tyrosine isonitrile synthase
MSIHQATAVDAATSLPQMRASGFNDVYGTSTYNVSCSDSASRIGRPHRDHSNGGGSAKPLQRKPTEAENVLRSFNTWSFKREHPAHPELMLQFISDAISRREPISFVLYWGKGPRCDIALPDIQCVDFLARLTHRVRQVYKPGATITLLFTDTHAELNGYSGPSMQRYFGMIEIEARLRGFEIQWLSKVVQETQLTLTREMAATTIPDETLRKLVPSALKWFHGHGTPVEGALRYYRLNMIEKRAVELAFPKSIFITFNGSDLRSLFPDQLPIFYMYSLRKGFSIKPWFIDAF